jgi:hypothetical protein
VNLLPCTIATPRAPKFTFTAALAAAIKRLLGGPKEHCFERSLLIWIKLVLQHSLFCNSARIIRANKAPHHDNMLSFVLQLEILNCAPLHFHFGLEAFEIAIDRGDCKHAPVPLVAQQAVLRHDIAVDRQLIPLLGMADIVDWDIIVLR